MIKIDKPTRQEIIEAIIPELSFVFPYTAQEYNENLFMENYHKHTYESNVRQIDSATGYEKYIAKTKEYQGKCLFSGEHGWQGQYYLTYKLANENNLKFRFSTEAYWVKDNQEKDKTNAHIILVAKNLEGLKEINYILSRANEDGYYFKPRIDKKLLFTLHPENVFVTSACIAGWKYEDATNIWLEVFKHFGSSFFLEVQCHDTPEQKRINKIIQALAQEYGINIIVGLDSHYVDEEDKIKRSNLLLRKNVRYADEDGWYMDYPTGEETYTRLKRQGVLSEKEILTAIMNTCIFINECEEIIFDQSFKIPSILKGYNNATKNKVFHDLLMKRYEKEKFQSDEKLAGIEYEYNEIAESGITDYFLTNHVIVRNAVEKYNGILTTTGRGSAGSFICNKILGFTTLDRFTSEIPIYPERFLTKDRICNSHQLPD